ncbi:HD domain-containing protein, partial [Bacteroidota bacterium]
LIYLGILKAVPSFNKKVLCVDVGGGSTEFIIGARGSIDYSLSVKVGHVRMAQKYFPDGLVTKERVKKCKRWIEGEIYRAVGNIKKHNVTTFIGSSGTVMSVGSMILKLEGESESSDTILNNFVFSSNDLKKITKRILNSTSTNERKKIKGLDAKRADSSPAAVIILNTIFEQIGIDQMTISGFALREGIVIDTLQKQKSDSDKPKLEDIRLESVKNLADKSQFDKKHCAHTAKLALQVFDQLCDLHNLDNSGREYLEAAARLHDIGYQISHTQHHRHSNYIIRNSELLGFNDNEINIIAHVARYHRKSHPKLRHKEFASLPEKSKGIVRKLAAILRVADSLDRTHLQRVKNISIRVKSISVELYLDYEETLPEIELWSFERRKELFEEVFGKKILIMN